MVQSGKTFTYSAANIADTDLDTIDDVLDDLTTSFSGPNSPSNGVPGMVWYDNNKYVLRHADHTAGTWRAIFAGSAAFKIWVYLDSETTEEGWARDSTVTDVVLGLKSTSGVYVTGAQVPAASSWTISGLTADVHQHAAGALAAAAHPHALQNQGVYTGSSSVAADGITIDGGRIKLVQSNSGTVYYASATTTSVGASVTGSTANTAAPSGVTHTPGWRIRAAVGIMVYPNI